MNDTILNLIYSHIPAEEILRSLEEDLKGKYKIIDVFGSTGGVDKEVIRALYEKNYNRTISPFVLGPFLSAEEIVEFSKLLCQELNAREIRILSVFDFNTGLEKYPSHEDFLKIFAECGHCITNTDQGKSFFDRFFKGN